MTNENEQRNTDDTVTHGTESVSAMRDAVQKYIDRAGMKVDLKTVEQQIRDRPFNRRRGRIRCRWRTSHMAWYGTSRVRSQRRLAKR